MCPLLQECALKRKAELGASGTQLLREAVRWELNREIDELVEWPCGAREVEHSVDEMDTETCLTGSRLSVSLAGYLRAGGHVPPA